MTVAFIPRDLCVKVSLAVEHILGMLAAGDTIDIILEGYPRLELEDLRVCLVSAHRIVGHERI